MNTNDRTVLPYLIKKIVEVQHQHYQKTQQFFHNSDQLKAVDIKRESLGSNSFFYPTQKPYCHEDDIGQQFSYSQMCVHLAPPMQMKAKPKIGEIYFGKEFTDHMFKVVYDRKSNGWQTPEITPLEDLILHPAAKVFHYALELFEGMKAFWGVDDKIRLFRPELNMARMNASAKRAGLPTFEPEEFIKCIARLVLIDKEWLPLGCSGSLYIRPTMIGTESKIGMGVSESALLYVVLSPVGDYFKGQPGGISLLADPQYCRAWFGGVGDLKLGSNYAPTIQIQKEAAKKGFQQVLWLFGDDHQVTEVGTMNLFILMINEQGEFELSTPELNGLILPGVTRHSILSLAREWKQYKVVERKITMGEIKKAADEKRLLEMFGTGTAVVISPIEKIHYMGEDLIVPTLEHSNSFWKKCLTTLTDIQYGRIKHPWAVVIE